MRIMESYEKTYMDVPDLIHCYNRKIPIANRQKYFCHKKKNSLKVSYWSRAEMSPYADAECHFLH